MEGKGATIRFTGPKWANILAGIAVVVLAIVVVASFIRIPYYAMSPGKAQPVSQLLTLPTDLVHKPRGSVLLTDVSVSDRPIRLIDLIPDWLSSNTVLVKAADLLGPTPANELAAQGAWEMETSKLSATAAALSMLGYPVAEKNQGAVIVVVLPHSPASRALRVGQVIVAMNGHPTPTAQQLSKYIRAARPGERVKLLVGRVGSNKVHNIEVTLGTRARTPYLGVLITTQHSFTFPFKVGIRSDQIGGPSAGLAFALGIIDELSGGQLTGGKVVAATGTITASGAVGPVGGVAEKTIAVERAGAQVFIVPKEEYKQALSKATPRLAVYPVSSLTGAIDVLKSLGGTLKLRTYHLNLSNKYPVRRE